MQFSLTQNSWADVELGGKQMLWYFNNRCQLSFGQDLEKEVP